MSVVNFLFSFSLAAGVFSVFDFLSCFGSIPAANSVIGPTDFAKGAMIDPFI